MGLVLRSVIFSDSLNWAVSMAQCSPNLFQWCDRQSILNMYLRSSTFNYNKIFQWNIKQSEKAERMKMNMRHPEGSKWPKVIFLSLQYYCTLLMWTFIIIVIIKQVYTLHYVYFFIILCWSVILPDKKGSILWRKWGDFWISIAHKITIVITKYFHIAWIHVVQISIRIYCKQKHWNI